MKTRILVATLFGWLISAGIIMAQPYGTGAIIDLNAYNKAPEADMAVLGFADDLPSAKSLKKFAPTPLNQGQYGTCVGWSSTYGVYTIEHARAYAITNKSLIDAQVWDPYFTYEMAQMKEDASCVTGVNIYNALNQMRTTGVKRFWLPEFDCQSEINDRIVSMAKPNRIKDFKRLFSYPDEWDGEWATFFAYDIEKVQPIKAALAAGHPVVMSMKLPESIFKVVNTDVWTPTEAERSMPAQQTLYGHAMTIVGYDDNKYGGAFEIMNSWGTEWGNAGFFWVRYEDFTKFGAEAYYIELFETPAAAKSGCVMGDCDNNYSRYYFEDGAMYEGELKDGQFHGYGMYVWPNGDLYAGGWYNGKQHGSGMVLAANNQTPIRGYWDSGTNVTYAVVNSAIESASSDVGCVEGDCQEGYGVYVESSTDGKTTYSGTWSGGLRHGYGKLELPNGAEYEGTWKNDVISGFGRLQFPDGYTYVGEWLNNKKHGLGILYNLFGWAAYEFFLDEALTGTDDASSQGTPKHADEGLRNIKGGTASAGGCLSGNCQNGEGKLVYSDNVSYQGFFKDGKRSGFGTLSWPDGYTIEGHFYNNQVDGIAKIMWPTGEYFIGEFRNGKRDGYGIEIGEKSYIPGIWEFGEYQQGKATLGFASNELETNTLDIEVSPSPGAQSVLNRMNSRTVQSIK